MADSIHLIKLSVGSETVEDMIAWQATLFRAKASPLTSDAELILQNLLSKLAI